MGTIFTIKILTELNDRIEYSCAFCDYKMSQKSQLKQQIKSNHDGVKYSCEVCEYEVSQKSQLQ